MRRQLLKFHHVFDIFEIREIQKPHIYPLVSTGTTDEKMAFQTISIRSLTQQILYDYVAENYVRYSYAYQSSTPRCVGPHDGRCIRDP